MPRRRTSRTRATTSGGSCTTRASRRGSTTRRSSSRCSSSATASRTPPTARRPARATCGAATSTRTRSTSGSCAVAPRAVAFVGKEAYRGLYRERPELGPQLHAIGPTGLYVLPSTSPANAAVPYAERLDWFRSLRAWLEPVEREAVRGARRSTGERPRAARPVRGPRPRPVWWGDARRRDRARARPTSRRCAASCSRRSACRSSSSARSSSSTRHSSRGRGGSTASGTSLPRPRRRARAGGRRSISRRRV